MSTAEARVERLIGKIEKTWTDFHDSYDGLSESEMLEPGATGDWSVRDLIAHVTVWEEETMKLLPMILHGKSTPKYSTEYGGVDAFNALMVDQKRHLSLAEVKQESEATHRRLVEYLRSLPPESIMSNERFKRRLRLDAHGHYPLHADSIREWREG